MQPTLKALRLAQAEVHRTAHNQDLTEVSKRARLDREAEGKCKRKCLTQESSNQSDDPDECPPASLHCAEKA